MTKDAASNFETIITASVRDIATVTPDGRSLQRLTDGVTFHESPTHSDARGEVVELFDPRWNWHPDPFAFAYYFTIRPGFVKGWNLHKEHDDRYMLVHGEMEIVLYDSREGSPTHGEVCRIVVSEYNRRIVCVPRNVWHADYNFGTKDVQVVNFPTRPYDHASPDKYRLPLDTTLIPYNFPPDAKGW